MNKEQFLAISLPHELKGYVDGKDTISGQNIYILLSCHYKATAVEVVSTVVGESDFFTDKSKFKPILHPLSDLTKEIEHNGEIIHVLTFLCEKYRNLNPHQLIAAIKSGIIDFNIMMDLIEFHFDVAGLIEKGEAIDVNTLSENPYK